MINKRLLIAVAVFCFAFLFYSSSHYFIFKSITGSNSSQTATTSIMAPAPSPPSNDELISFLSESKKNFLAALSGANSSTSLADWVVVTGNEAGGQNTKYVSAHSYVRGINKHYMNRS